METGSVVISLSGRDKGTFYLVIKSTENRVYLVDGKVRKIRRPKIKNVKHVAFTGKNLKAAAEDILSGAPYGNQRLKKELNALSREINRRK